MSTDSREQILAEFQDFTGLDDMTECIHVLDQHEWHLQNAVQSVHDRFEGGNTNESIAATTNTNIINHKRQSESDDIDDSDGLRIIKTIPGGQRTIRGTSSTESKRLARDLQFTIEYLDQTEHITISDNENVFQLRVKISEKFDILPNKQNFLEWMTQSYDDQTILRDLNLPKENTIHLSVAENGSDSRTHNHTTSSTGDFPITVLCEDKSGSTLIPYHLVLKPNTTIGEMKKQIEQYAHIPVAQQTWNGLLGANDSDELRETSVARKAHLHVRHSDASLNQHIPTTGRNPNRSIISTDRSEDDQMDIDQEIAFGPDDDDISVLSQNNSTTTTASGTISNREPLIPDECTDDALGLEHFSQVFHARYGLTGPILYIGSLDQAIQDSLYLSRDERRPLAIYLHNDQSVCANVFCSQVLSSESIVEYLATNYVVWAWDITSDSNRTRLLDTLKRSVGGQCAQRVFSTENDVFPLLLIIIRSRGSLELINVIEGKSTLDEVFHNLVQSYESFDQQRERDAEEEIMREKRENLKKQQEDEYEQSREADLAKERARQKEQDDNEKIKQERLQKQQECIARLPEEPNETEKNITRLKIRLPDDDGVLLRRFRITDTLQVLFDYLTIQGRMLGEYKLLTTFPKRDLAALNQSDTFEQLKLYPQEQLILESL